MAKEEPLKALWRTMHARCANPNHNRYHRYGGRGITVCPEWADYETFRAWATSSGYKRGLQIDRINTDGSYNPENCRWADSKTNNRNRNNNRLVTHEGVTKTLAEWADDPRCAVTYAVLWERLDYGWTFERALTEPQRRKGGWRLITAWGETKSLSEWLKDPRCAEGLVDRTLWKRVNDGWPSERAVSQPVRRR